MPVYLDGVHAVVVVATAGAANHHVTAAGCGPDSELLRQSRGPGGTIRANGMAVSAVE